ncbi:TPA: hypothetical protein ACXI12_001279 [Pseudomonas aeruginosa]
MGIRLELLCINSEDPSTDDCYTIDEKGVGVTADDSQADVSRQYKLLQEMAHRHGWRWTKLAQGPKGWLCPSCVKLYEEQTGHALSEPESNSQNGVMTVPLSTGEMAQVVKRMHDMGLSVESIAVKTGMALRKICHLLALACLPPEVFELYKRGEVAGSIALRLVCVLGGDKASELLRELLEKHGAVGFSDHGERLIAELTKRIGVTLPPEVAD